MNVILNWINSQKEFLTLLISFLVAVITLFYTIITRRMLHLSSQPSIKIDSKSIKISPDINKELTMKNCEKVIGDAIRCCITIELEITNIGNCPAQDICVDANVFFIKRKPFGYKKLPVHLPDFINILSPIAIQKDSSIKTHVCFDNFVAREINKDYFKSKENYIGFPISPLAKELNDSKLWHSPKICIECFYTDIQGNNYCASLQLFFHMYYDEEKKKMNICLLNMFDFNFASIRRITKFARSTYFKNTRKLRYTAFDGKKYNKNILHVYSAKRRKKS